MASMSSLSDDFTGSSLDGTTWTSFTQGSATVSESSAGLTFTLPSNFPQVAGINSNASYDLTGSYALINFAGPGHAASASFPTDMGIALQPALDTSIETENDLHFYLSSGSVFVGYRSAGATHEWLVSGSQPAWNGTNYAWCRIRESGGTIFWDTSPDGSAWTNRFSAGTPFTITGLYCKIWAHNWDTSAPSSTEQFAHLNPVASTPVSDADAAAGAGGSEALLVSDTDAGAAAESQAATPLTGADAAVAAESQQVSPLTPVSDTDASAAAESQASAPVTLPSREALLFMQVAAVPVSQDSAAVPIAMRAAAVPITMSAVRSLP